MTRCDRWAEGVTRAARVIASEAFVAVDQIVFVERIIFDISRKTINNNEKYMHITIMKIRNIIYSFACMKKKKKFEVYKLLKYFQRVIKYRWKQKKEAYTRV